MRGIAWTLVLACAGACGTSQHGVYITVKVTDPAVGTVALYIGDADCSIPENNTSVSCAALTPSDESSPLRVGSNGGAYFRDSNVTFTSKVTNGVAHLHLEATGSAKTVEIIAIGFAGDPAAKDARMVKVLDGVTIPNGDVVEIQTTLEAAAPVAKNEDPRVAQPDGHNVLVWASANAPAECVLAEEWSSGKAKRTYVVPSDDADCDGLPTMNANGSGRNPLECDPLWFSRPTPIGSGNSDCAADGVFTANGVTTQGVCMIGGPACIDGIGVSSATCAPLANDALCLPQAVCGLHCAMPPPTGGPLGACLDGLETGNVPFPHYECTFFTDPNGGPCPGATTSTSVDLGALFVGSQKTCSDITWSPDSLVAFMPSATLAFSGTPATFQTQTSGDPCTLQIDWTGGALAPFDQTWLLADVKVTDTQHLVVPFKFTHDLCSMTGTTDSIVCMPAGPASATPDSMLSCAK